MSHGVLHDTMCGCAPGQALAVLRGMLGYTKLGCATALLHNTMHSMVAWRTTRN